jgi:hypothetical protein
MECITINIVRVVSLRRSDDNFSWTSPEIPSITNSYVKPIFIKQNDELGAKNKADLK